MTESAGSSLTNTASASATASVGGTVSSSLLTAESTASADMGTGAGMTAELEAPLMEQALQIAPIGIALCKADNKGGVCSALGVFTK